MKLFLPPNARKAAYAPGSLLSLEAKPGGRVTERPRGLLEHPQGREEVRVDDGGAALLEVVREGEEELEHVRDLGKLNVRENEN